MIHGKDVVQALYKTLLLREAEEPSLSTRAAALEAGTLAIDKLLKEILTSPEFQGKFGIFTSSLGVEYPFTNNQTQYNEMDLLLKHIVNAMPQEKVVIDVGARGKARSNSWDLMKTFGWRGVLVEANPSLYSQIRDEFSGLPYQLVECAVSDYNGEATFTIGSNDDVSSLNAGAAANWGDTKGEITVPVRRLPEILAERHIAKEFGLLSIDIEGEDIKVINDLIDNSAYRPKYVIIEASYDFKVKSLNDLPVSARVEDLYEIVGQTSANLILHRRH